MRSCLIQLLITAAVAFAVLWFGLPFGASWLATNALGAAGFNGTDTKVEVSANVPPRILLGHADSIRLTSSQVSAGGLNAATLDVTLSDVDLFGRKFDTVTGTLTGVRVAAPSGDPIPIDTVTLSGQGTAAKAILTVSNTEIETLVASELKAQTGAVATVKLAAPNLATITVNGQSEQGHLVVRGGELQLVPVSGALPTLTLMGAGSSDPFALSSVAVGAKTVTLDGTIDLQALLGL
jgi:hypothetical protein